MSVLSQSLSPQLPRPGEKTGAGKEDFPGKEDEHLKSKKDEFSKSKNNIFSSQ